LEVCRKLMGSAIARYWLNSFSQIRLQSEWLLSFCCWKSPIQWWFKGTLRLWRLPSSSIRPHSIDGWNCVSSRLSIPWNLWLKVMPFLDFNRSSNICRVHWRFYEGRDCDFSFFSTKPSTTSFWF
jgi:hypothetical protein